MIRAIGENVLVKPDEFQSKTAGGVFLPDDHVDRAKYKTSRGVIVSMGSKAFVLGGEVIADAPKVGDTVIYQTYEGSVEKDADGVEHRIMLDQAIIGVVT